ncbi:probable ATP-dependent RNA helicase DHX34 [Rhipicephalus sanguineus]|uniref:probable ATP-dependent RNA helicase DHX34 n=1 Tax=Rhipicephalus sanguineus TaxID=34632 RepID=UPI0018939E3F|nr:probable ATP-dependent RNA helicase DHX34 [Rhipicephalus sanguineus]
MGRDHDRRHHHKSSHKRKRSEDLGDSDSGHSKHGRRRSSSSRYDSNHHGDRDSGRERQHSSTRRDSGDYIDDRRTVPRRREQRHGSPNDTDRVQPKAERNSRTGERKNLSQFRHELSRIFFGDNSPISRNSKQYDNFWTFLKKYEERKQKTAVEAGTSKADPWECAEQSLGLPPTYDPVHKVNFSIFPEEPKVLMLDAGVHIDSSDASHSLTEEDVAEVRTVFHLYLDFLQRQKFQKLKKLREFQKNLPIAQYKDGILKVVSENSVVLIAGDTGCGKSTQIPQYLLGAGLEGIACTQPRRIAAISLCKRVAYETLNEYRTHIGYQIRFEKHRSKHTKMLFLTEGLLLRQIASDPMLKEYNVIILDEIHERHLTCDFLLGVVKCLMQHRKDLKIILMSATINIQLFSQYFYNCPVVQVPGRLFPIQVQYHPVTVEEKRSRTGRLNPAPYVKLLSLIDNKYPSNERGDLLVFLSGMSEISAVQEAAEEYANQNGHWIILPLHSTLSLAEQDKVFDYAPEKTRKCILSTNIAETSVTIDGVRFVVDSGKVKEMSYDSASHMQKLKEFWISRASAEQRKGRAGRTGPGVCFRLYSEAEYEALAAYSTPEIQRVPLNSLLLQLVALGLPDVRKFPFLEPPPSESIEEAVQTLKEQGALTADEDLTPTGRILSQLPVDVTIGKVLILGCVFRLVDPILSLAAALSIQSPFTQRSFRDLDASAARKSVDSDHGDPFTLLNAYHEWLAAKSSYGEDTRKWCRRLGLEEQRFYEMTKLRSQFKKLLQEVGLMENEVEVTDSVARIQRHGEMKQLRDLRRQLQKAPRKKRILRIGNWGDEDEEEEQVDIKDVEFRLQQDPTLVQEFLRRSRSFGFHDLSLMKLILCSGVYPQIAISDDHNSYKRDSDQLFHTKGKGFVVLHPNSVLALHAEVLRLDDMDVLTVPNFRSNLPVSSKHQVVAFMSLLETTKPYLLNCLRVQCVQMLLLVSSAIDSSMTMSRLVFDEFVEVTFPDPDEALQLLLKVLAARNLYERLVAHMLEETLSSEDKKEPSPQVRHMQKQLRKRYDAVLKTEIAYTVKRLLPADVKHLYAGAQAFRALAQENEDGLSEDRFKMNPRKGGVFISGYFTFGCLEEISMPEETLVDKTCKCPLCDLELPFAVMDAVLHLDACDKDNLITKDAGSCPPTEDEVLAEDDKSDPLKKAYFCKECSRELRLTLPEIFQHRKTHQSTSQDG